MYFNLVPRACYPREGTRRSGIIRCRKPGILAKIELRMPFQRPIRILPETDYPRASRSFPRIAGSGNEIVCICITRGKNNHFRLFFPRVMQLYSLQNLRTSQGYIFFILQQFAIKLCNCTHFKMLFPAMIMDFVLLV